MEQDNLITHLLNLAETDSTAFRQAISECSADDLEAFSRISYTLFPDRSWPLITIAKTLSGKNQDDVVVRIMEIALLIKPVDFHAIANYARALHLTGRYSEIALHIDRYLPREDEEEQALLLYHKANALFDLGQTEDAILLATEAYNTFSENDEVAFIYGYAMYKQKKYTEAIALYTKAISLDAEINFAYAYIALVYVDCGDFINAVNTIRKLSEIKPENLSNMVEFSQFKQLLDSEFGAQVQEIFKKEGIELR